MAAEDEQVWRVMYAVLFAMMDQPSAFFAPGIVLKVLLWRARNLLRRASQRGRGDSKRSAARLRP